MSGRIPTSPNHHREIRQALEEPGQNPPTPPEVTVERPVIFEVEVSPEEEELHGIRASPLLGRLPLVREGDRHAARRRDILRRQAGPLARLGEEPRRYLLSRIDGFGRLFRFSERRARLFRTS